MCASTPITRRRGLGVCSGNRSRVDSAWALKLNHLRCDPPAAAWLCAMSCRGRRRLVGSFRLGQTGSLSLIVMAQAQAAVPARPRPRWQVPLLVGFCFGLGYGITHRLLALQLPALVRLGQGFEVRPFPGTSLESLRLRFGADNQDIRGDLDVMELEQKAGADPTATEPAESPTSDPDSGLRDIEVAPGSLPDDAPDRAPQAKPAPQSPAPRLDAPAPPPLPSADLPQFSPEAGPR